jgi:phosphoribosylformylglycinamidine synthase
MAVAEACRNVSCAGARPIALTDCLNFGDPERPAVWETLCEVIEGIREACLALEVPIISGNVSLYNESTGVSILPTPVVGALGVIDDLHRHGRAKLASGQLVWLLGAMEATLSGSEYAAALHGWEEGEPASIDLEMERRVQACVRELIGNGIVNAATDVSDGGLAVALAELALASTVGVICDEPWVRDLESGAMGRRDAVLFGEAPSRIIIASGAAAAEQVERAAAHWGIPLTRLGSAGGEEIRIGGLVSVTLADARARWAEAIDHLAE